MKKLIALALVLVCIVSLCSCGWNSQKAVATVFSENVTKVDITHRIGTAATHWNIEGTEIDTLREWYNKLNYKVIEVKEGQSPGDSNGNEVYTFAFTGGEWSGFSYVINGENDCYILNPEGNWFFVTNPTTPPVSEPADIVSFRAKVLDVKDNYFLVEPLADSNESKSADKIEIPLAGKTSWPVPAVGDTVNVFYSGGIQETYPARIAKVHRVEIETTSAYTYEELSEMPAKELLDLFIQNGLVINDDFKASFTEEELQTLFKENFHLWHTGVSAHSYTMYIDLAEQTKIIYDKIVEPIK